MSWISSAQTKYHSVCVSVSPLITVASWARKVARHNCANTKMNNVTKMPPLKASQA